MKKLPSITTSLLLAFTAFSSSAAEDPAHNELRILRTNVLESIKAGDVNKTLPYAHTNIVITWQNNEVCRGHDGLKDFFNRLGKDAFKNYVVPPTPDELTHLYGNTGVSFGTSVAEYQLLGKPFTFTNRWTATVVKENDKWLLAGYHVSLNALDNPILNGAKRGIFMVGSGCGLFGLIAGFFIGRAKKPKAS